MEPQDYPIAHFNQTAELATALKSLPAQILEHQYSYEGFGSWWATVRHRGVCYRIVLDGRDGQVSIECSSSEAIRPWDKTLWERSVGVGSQLPVAEVVGAIRWAGTTD
jgi:hypothetical protein